jgi:hypothetical protein
MLRLLNNQHSAACRSESRREGVCTFGHTLRILQQLRGQCKIRSAPQSTVGDEPRRNCHYRTESCELAPPPLRAEERDELRGGVDDVACFPRTGFEGRFEGAFTNTKGRGR